MTNINRLGDAPSGIVFQRQGAFGGPAGNLRERRGLQTGFSERDPFGFDDETSASSNTTEREADFLKALRDVDRDSRRDTADEQRDQQDDQIPNPDVVLVVAEQQLWTGLPSPASAVADTDTVRLSADTTINSIMEAIDRSIRTEMAPRSGATLDIAIAFSDDAIGLAGLRIIVTRDTLDVMFERTGSTFSEEFVRAAEALAHRLMTRFSKRTVRILDATPADNRDQQSAADTIMPPTRPRPFI